MKKLIACMISALVLCAVLCGCGNDRIANNDSSLSNPTVTEGVSPSEMPEIFNDDGFVDDKDGIIKDDADKSTENNSGSNTTQSSDTPAATAKP